MADYPEEMLWAETFSVTKQIFYRVSTLHLYAFKWS